VLLYSPPFTENWFFSSRRNAAVQPVLKLTLYSYKLFPAWISSQYPGYQHQHSSFSWHWSISPANTPSLPLHRFAPYQFHDIAPPKDPHYPSCHKTLAMQALDSQNSDPVSFLTPIGTLPPVIFSAFSTRPIVWLRVPGPRKPPPTIRPDAYNRSWNL
jgi:hypothetical protein